ncbi:hypothetical protein E8E11_001437 [Didymella keratinophila]|nr:hypothetical protein E8E11_001437 [Didymella keratinophila]
MLVYHPDKNPNASDEQKAELKTKSQEANSAREILQESKRRREYDDTIHRAAKCRRRSYPSDGQSEGYDTEPDSSAYTRSPPPPPPPLKKFPRTPEIASHGWAMPIIVRGNHEPHDWGQGSVFCEENRIFVSMKIRPSGCGNAFNKTDVHIEICRTPENSRIFKIESLYKHCMQPDGMDE